MNAHALRSVSVRASVGTASCVDRRHPRCGQCDRSNRKGAAAAASFGRNPSSVILNFNRRNRGRTGRSICCAGSEARGPGETDKGEDEKKSEEPRRSLAIAFTCNKCGARTTRKVNPRALAKGTVFVQCSNCETFHKLVDNLELIEEYDLTQDD
mmetsp:Transcript_4389/g.11382  ORF Transcript_4389/g.11382 Transcript_4389/m.11382 type:complete len:154 (+) Transcript_4389:122-583(+)